MKNPLLAAAWLIAAVAPVLTVVAQAQSAPLAPAGRPDPLHAEAAVPPASYRSALTGYRPWAEEKLAPWKETNDTVGRIGGWRVYARQAQEPAATPDASTPTTPTAPGGLKPMPGHMMQ
jgi:hypothetical protein